MTKALLCMVKCLWHASWHAAKHASWHGGHMWIVQYNRAACQCVLTFQWDSYIVGSGLADLSTWLGVLLTNFRHATAPRHVKPQCQPGVDQVTV